MEDYIDPIDDGEISGHSTYSFDIDLNKVMERYKNILYQASSCKCMRIQKLLRWVIRIV